MYWTKYLAAELGSATGSYASIVSSRQTRSPWKQSATTGSWMLLPSTLIARSLVFWLARR